MSCPPGCQSQINNLQQQLDKLQQELNQLKQSQQLLPGGMTAGKARLRIGGDSARVNFAPYRFTAPPHVVVSLARTLDPQIDAAGPLYVQKTDKDGFSVKFLRPPASEAGAVDIDIFWIASS